ncbi:Flp family type IVb pilin [Oceanisphaera sp. KMM 10153]|uniref:Flp family type IVb pilin n=1 Tax=Oceanisphaera submarina TaxID=3390193 RepID=UPI00397698CB
MNDIFIKGCINLHIKIKQLLQREDGASAIEYGIIAGLIAVGIITSASEIGVKLAEFFADISTKIGAAPPTSPDPN